MKGCGPKEFLSLFINADFICTDSFHGTAFSINLNKPFFAYMEKTSYLSRIRNLLELLDIEDRLIYPDTILDENIKQIDYSLVNEKLEKERIRSLDFLQTALEDGGNK